MLTDYDGRTPPRISRFPHPLVYWCIDQYFIQQCLSPHRERDSCVTQEVETLDFAFSTPVGLSEL